MIIPKIVFVFDRRKRATRTKEGSIEMCVTANGKRKYISTGMTCLPNCWRAGRITGGKDIIRANEQLQVLIGKATDIITQMMKDNALDLDALPRMIKGEIVRQDTFLSYFREVTRSRYKDITASTKKHYECCIRFLEKWKGIVTFADCNQKSVDKLDSELRKRGLKESSRWNYHKIVKIAMQKAQDEGLIKINPYRLMKLKRGTENGLLRVLTPDEFHRFESCEIDDEKLERVRDLFVFQTYTMMGYADLEAFDRKKCTEIKGKMVYRACRVKTNQPFTIVITDEAKNILRKYQNKLPIISNQKYNDYLKLAVRYARIKKDVTSHYARHTGATMLLNEKKLPMHVIQKMLGHASIRETEKTYAKLMDETIVDWML